MNKTCSKCKSEKPLEDFSHRNKSKGTRASVCKQCFRDYDKKHWLWVSSEEVRGLSPESLPTIARRAAGKRQGGQWQRKSARNNSGSEATLVASDVHNCEHFNSSSKLRSISEAP